MDVTTIINLIIQIAEIAMKYGPQVITNFETTWSDLKLAYQSATQGTPLTPDQQSQIDTALDNANTALQAAIAAEQAQV